MESRQARRWLVRVAARRDSTKRGRHGALMLDPSAAVANQMLERETWARQRLAAHAGRTFVLVATPIVAPFRITDTGLLEPYALADGPADLRLSIQTCAVPDILVAQYM